MTHNHGIKELLTLAAKACGYTLEDHYDVNEIYYPWCHEIRGGLGDYWAPHADDGDCFRMETELKIEPRHNGECVVATAFQVVDGFVEFLGIDVLLQTTTATKTQHAGWLA